MKGVVYGTTSAVAEGGSVQLGGRVVVVAGLDNGVCKVVCWCLFGLNPYMEKAPIWHSLPSLVVRFALLLTTAYIGSCTGALFAKALPNTMRVL